MRDYIIRVGAAPLITVTGTGLVDTKINSEGLLRLFTKFSTPENYPLYGIRNTSCMLLRTLPNTLLIIHTYVLTSLCIIYGAGVPGVKMVNVECTYYINVQVKRKVVIMGSYNVHVPCLIQYSSQAT